MFCSIPSIIVCSILTLLAACSGIKKETGYYKTRQPISSDSAKIIKAGIRNSIDNDIFQSFQYTGNNQIVIQYRLLAPTSVAETSLEIRPQSDRETTTGKIKHPLVLILHSSGGIGTDNKSQLEVMAKFWAQPAIQAKYPAYIVVPQFPQRSSNYEMSPDKHVLVSRPDPCLSTALQLIDSLKKALSVDEKRIYVMGFSMGASATINSIELRPDLFAAAISISGIPAFDHLNTLAQTPIWFIHGNADSENPYSSDSLLYKELQTLHAPQIRFWEIEGLEHTIYSGLYTGDAVPRWLFSHKRRP